MEKIEKKKTKMMEVLMPREKHEWKTNVDQRWVRTGCTGLWDAVFMAFRDYRDATPQAQADMIKERALVSVDTDLDDLPLRMEEFIYRQNIDDLPQELAESIMLYQRLISQRLFRTELLPYLGSFIRDSPHVNRECIRAESYDKSVLLGEYRSKKKKLDDVDPEEIAKKFQIVITGFFTNTTPVSYDVVQRACKNMEYHVIIVSPTLQTLFDSKSWDEGMNEAEFNDVIIVLAHPSGNYESIGRMSYTKDGNQKISRLFHYDDEVISFLRQNKDASASS